MDEFEQSDLEKETNDSHNTFCQNAIHYKAWFPLHVKWHDHYTKTKRL